MKEFKRDWKFCVKANTLPEEIIYVVGSCAELGNWLSDASVELTKEDSSTEYDMWAGVVSIPVEQEIFFRYFVGIVNEPEYSSSNTRKIIVRRWETHISPRVIEANAGSNVNEECVGDSFGIYKQVQCVQRGWLTSETVIQFKLFNNPVELWKRRHQERNVYLKVTPMCLSPRRTSGSILVPTDPTDESVDTHDHTDHPHGLPLAEVAIMNEEGCELHRQNQFGHMYKEDQFVLFHIYVHHFETVAYLIDFYVRGAKDSSEDPPSHLGFCYILPSVLKRSEGQAIVPITSNKHRPIGQLTVEYLVIRPIQSLDCDMHVSYARFWKESWLGLDVGHRGLGTSFKHEIHSSANVRENTIASLKRAAMCGADIVEFDVQLTKDLVPVLYHDFHVCIAMKYKKLLEKHDMLELPVKDLTLEQLQLLKIYHVEEGKNKNPRFFDEDLEEHQPFPTLEHALEALDPHVGFNVEIKWTMQLKDGSFELYDPLDLNLYLDTVLKVVLQHAGNRKIVFSCFHPDICTMIRLKQNKYPVMFLTQGITKKYPAYHDARTQSIPMGVHFAICMGILGINVHTEDLLRDSTQVKLVTDAGLVIFCWGDDNNSLSTIKHLKKLGLHAIIYDKIDEYGMKDVKESIFLMEEREAQKALYRVAQASDQSLPQSPSPSASVYMENLSASQQSLSSMKMSPVAAVDSVCNSLGCKSQNEKVTESSAS